MRSPTPKPLPTNHPEFAVRCEAFNRFFDKPLPRSTFHDLVGKGKIVPLKGLRGFYKLNESLRRMGLREVPSIPVTSKRSTEDILRLAFTLIDPDIFPAPAWALTEIALDPQMADHALLIADQHRESILGLTTVPEKLSYCHRPPRA